MLLDHKHAIYADSGCLAETVMHKGNRWTAEGTLHQFYMLTHFPFLLTVLTFEEEGKCLEDKEKRKRLNYVEKKDKS